MTTAAPPSQRAEDAMQRFDASRVAMFRRTRREGLIALGVSVGLTIAAFVLEKAAKGKATVASVEVLAVQSVMLSTAFPLACVSVIRIFQSANYPAGKWTADWIDHFSILWATGYVAWLLLKVTALWP